MKLVGTLYLTPGAPLNPKETEAPGAMEPLQLSGLMDQDSPDQLVTLAFQMLVTWPSKVQPNCQGFKVAVVLLVIVTVAV